MSEETPVIIKELCEVLNRHEVSEVVVMGRMKEGDYFSIKTVDDAIGMLGYMEIIKSEILKDYDKKRAS